MEGAAKKSLKKGDFEGGVRSVGGEETQRWAGGTVAVEPAVGGEGTLEVPEGWLRASDEPNQWRHYCSCFYWQ